MHAITPAHLEHRPRLHYVFDLWADLWRSQRAKGDVIIVRFADDVIVGFEHREDAERFQEELAERLRKFDLELHPDKTRLIRFGRSAHREHHQGVWLGQVVRGWFGYHGVPFNIDALSRFRHEVVRRWFWALRRRSQRGNRLTWSRFYRYVE